MLCVSENYCRGQIRLTTRMPSMNNATEQRLRGLAEEVKPEMPEVASHAYGQVTSHSCARLHPSACIST
jgi:hypothetical protein